MEDIDLLEEAKRRYPIGTVYSPAHLNTGRSIVYSHSFYVNKDGYVLLGDGNRVINGHGWSEILFYNGNWASVIAYPDVYIVDVTDTYSIY